MKKTRLTIILLMILTLVSAIITLCMGAVRIPVQDTLSILLRHLFGTDTGTSVSVAFEQIVWQIRMPRIILGFLAGSGLALCGCVMQAVVQNPMADPYILGVSAGATLGATGSLFLGLGVISGFWAFVGAGGACFLVLALSSADGKTTSVKLILSGMIVNALLTAFSNFIIAVAGDSDGMMSIKFWTMGSLTRAGWKNIGLIALIVLAAAGFFRTQAQTLDGLMLGEEAASTIGINTFRCRLVYLLVLSVLTGALVSVCGTIGFVGLIIPHVSRAIAGTAHRKLLPVADDLRLALLKGAVQIQGAVCQCDAVSDRREVLHLCRQLQYVHDIADSFGDICADMVSQHIENFTAQVHGVCDPAVRGEKCAIHIEELVGAEKIVTKQGFVEEAFLDPCRGKVVSHRHTSFLRCCGFSMWQILPH